MFTLDNINFQTPPVVCDHMAKMAKDCNVIGINSYLTVLEPTPGKGNLVGALNDHGFVVYGPGSLDFWVSPVNVYSSKYDFVVMNPPFFPIKEMERFILRAQELSNNVIMLIPYIYIINSERRLNQLKSFGMVSITNLPRKTFPKSRVQTCIVHLKKNHSGDTLFKTFEF